MGHEPSFQLSAEDRALLEGWVSGRKRALSAAVLAQVVEMTLREKPPAGTHWSARKLAKVAGLSRSSIQRIWAAHGLKPHLTKI